MKVDPCDWVRDLRFDDLPATVRRHARRCLLDTLGVAAGATRTRVAAIMAAFVRTQMPGEQGLLFAAGGASPAGAVLYGAALIDSLDAHDGHVLTKGHAGVAVVPALLAVPDAALADGREWLTRLVIGYEVATRAGIALHATAADYHTSGAWNALGVAAIAGRQLGLDAGALDEAFGAAEFYAPRSPMMRCIDHPTMVKDGSAWGALAGMSAALLARDGFTGAPASTLRDPAVASIWADLGTRWYVLEQYFKPYPVCRWAQPAMAAIRQVRDAAVLVPEAVTGIEVETFHAACRLATTHPATTEEAQYSLPWAVACALLGDGVSADDVAPEALAEPQRQALAASVRLVESEAFDRLFPAERWARVRLYLNDGREFESEPCQAPGDFDRPLDDVVFDTKYRTLAEPVLGLERADAIKEAVDRLEQGGSCDALQGLLQEPP